MNWNFHKPIFSFVSDLTSAALTNSFTLQWTYPSDFSNPIISHDSSPVIEYKLYRHIEIKTPSISANGGPYADASTYNTPFYTPTDRPEPIFKLIATLSPSTTSYVDQLNDLGIHADEGLSYVNGVWVDPLGTNILDDIFHTNRRIYYKIVATSKQMVFNGLPFIYLCHTDGVECRSTITQVKWNTLYYEGDTIWFNSAITNRNRTAIDLTFDVATSRYFNVWISGTDNTVYCLDGRDGKKLAQFTLPFSNIFGLRVDPDTGDGIVVGSNNFVYRCNLSSGVVALRDINTAYSPNGNNGLTITKEGNDHYAYVIANEDTVSKCGIDTSFNNVVPRTYFGCRNETNANIPNILGITNGSDSGIWVNGHVPIHYVYYYSYTSYSTTCGWQGICAPNGSPPGDWAAQWNANHPTLPGARCESRHYECQQVATTVTISVDLNFLQDIGYVYGATEGVNKGISNGQPSPYGVGTYKPFTSTANRTGWYGVTRTGGGDADGKPYTSGSTTNPETAPNPGTSQKGLATDIQTDGMLSGCHYNIFQVNEFENTIHKLYWNCSTLDYNYTGTVPEGVLNQDYWLITNPVHTAVDSQNTVWVIQENTPNQLTLVYQMANTGVFPIGGTCQWPAFLSPNTNLAVGYVYGIPYNDPHIEFYLTRKLSLSPALTTTPTDGYRAGFGVCLSGDLGEQKQLARSWCLNGTNYLTEGKRVHTFYAGPSSMHSFARYGGDTTEYNSDNLGTCYAFAQHSIDTYPDIIHPSEVYPSIDLKISKIDSSPTNCDSDFWNDQDIDNHPQHTAASGYDDFQVELSATLLSMGSFIFEAWEFFYDDKLQDVGGDVNPIYLNTQNNVVNYVYHDPSLNGKPNNRTKTWPAETNGMFNPYVVIDINTNAYYVTGDPIINSTSNLVTSVVWERWPTAKFYATPFDTASIRQNYLTSWHLTSYAYPVGDNGFPIDSESRIISGYDPLSAQFTDISITRTWPMSAWVWVFGDRLDYAGFALDNSVIGVSYPHVINTNIYNSTPASQRDDCISEHENMVEHIYKGPGNYIATLWVAASNTETSSWNISAGVTDQNVMISSFTIAASRQINVLEICPNMEYWVVSAQTVSANYSDDSNMFSFVSANSRYDGRWTTYGLVSGYAPYVIVSFAGEATARSLPFSALKWDYTDPYSDPNLLDYTFYAFPTAGWPTWNDFPYQASGTHTFIMPGFYDVTFVPVVSSPNVGYISNCTGLRKNMHVYVEEIYPHACFVNSFSATEGYTFGVLSGTSPITIYFNSSCTMAGSFPICRIDWDFGDYSPLMTISRLMSGEYLNYYNSSAYADLSDPRNIIVSHQYYRTTFNQPETYTITLSVYACNTNTVNTLSTQIGPIELAKLADVEGDIHLVENRMYNQENDLLLIFEGQKNLNNYTVLLSSENL